MTKLSNNRHEAALCGGYAPRPQASALLVDEIVQQLLPHSPRIRLGSRNAGTCYVQVAGVRRKGGRVLAVQFWCV